MHEFLSSFREGELVYYLNAKGRKEIGSETVRRRTPHVRHTLMRNEVYISLDPVDLWREEYTLKWDDKAIVADALFKKDGVFTLLEVDHTQLMSENEKKIQLYRDLHDTGRWQAKNGPFPEILYVTTTEHRQKRLSTLLEGMKARVLTFADIK